MFNQENSLENEGENNMILTPLIKEEEEQYEFYNNTDVDYDVFYSDNEMMCPMYIECLADSGTTSHIFKSWSVFLDYQQTTDIFIGGVRGTKMQAYGKGTVIAVAEHSAGKSLIKFKHALQCSYLQT